MLLNAVRLAGDDRRPSSSGENAASARRMLEAMSEGGSLETLMLVCRMDSGTILAWRGGGGRREASEPECRWRVATNWPEHAQAHERAASPCTAWLKGAARVPLCSPLSPAQRAPEARR